MTDELKPCPFCGGNDIYRIFGDNTSVCRTCGAQGPWKLGYVWNSRHEPDTLPQWAIKEINGRMNFTGAVSNTGIMHNDNATAAFNAALEWVLSLRKPVVRE